MSERKWTPGEWKCSRPDMLSFNATTGVQESFVYPGDEERVCVRTSRPVEDARLMAAAPDLYEALEKLLTKFKNCMRAHKNDDDVIADATAFASAALAKARGEIT